MNRKEEKMLLEIKKYLLKDRAALPEMLLPTPFDTLPNQFDLVNNFIEKEFYLSLYEIINNPPDFLTEFLYRNRLISFLLILSKSVPENILDETDNSRERQIANLKEYFINNFIEQCITKMSPMLKILFYRVYNRNALPSLIILETEPRIKTTIKNIIRKIKKGFSRNESEPEKDFKKLVYKIKSEEDKELINYIIDWVRLKLSFLINEISIYRAAMIKTDDYKALANRPLDSWGRYDVLHQIKINTLSQKESDLELLDSLVDRIELEFLMRPLQDFFNTYETKHFKTE